MKTTYICPDCGHEFIQGEFNYNYDYATLDFECPDCGWTGTDSTVETGDTRYATNIKWDTDDCNSDVDEEEIDHLPTAVEIPSYIEDYEVADWLSDEYGFCVFGFDIEKNLE